MVLNTGNFLLSNQNSNTGFRNPYRFEIEIIFDIEVSSYGGLHAELMIVTRIMGRHAEEGNRGRVRLTSSGLGPT